MTVSPLAGKPPGSAPTEVTAPGASADRPCNSGALMRDPYLRLGGAKLGLDSQELSFCWASSKLARVVQPKR